MLRSRGGRWSCSATRTPFDSTISPPSTDVSPASMRSSVVLPEPLRPDRVSRSRRSSLNETPRSSGSPAMSLARSEAMTTAMAIEDRYPRGMVRAALLSLSLLLLSSAPAFAQASDQGEGTYGPAGDKVVTDVGFMLIAGFPLLVLILSLIQNGLDKRKYRRMAAAKAR